MAISLFFSQLEENFSSQGRRRNWGPGGWQSAKWREVILSRIVHFCGRAVVVHGRARGGHCCWMRQGGIVAAGPSKKLGAQTVVYPPILGHRSECRVAHRPQAGVLTGQRWTENFSFVSSLDVLKVLLIQMFRHGIDKVFFLNVLYLFNVFFNTLNKIIWNFKIIKFLQSEKDKMKS